MNEQIETPENIIEVKKLWKVFGNESKKIIGQKYKNMSKEDIHKKTGCIVGVRDVSFEIKRGEFYILMGLSGSGKSTLVRNLIRLVNPTSGQITVNGKDLTKMSKADELPQTLNEYISFVEYFVGVPVKIVSVGPDRKQTIIM